MPGLDLYYAADVCYVIDMMRRRSPLARMTPRYRVYSAFEKAVFGAQSKTHIMVLSEAEKKNYQAVYGTKEERFHFLPPGIDKEKIHADATPNARAEIRHELGVREDQFLLLMIGSDFERKGVARSLRAFSSLPEELRTRCRLCVIGKGKTRRFVRLAERLRLGRQVVFPGARFDVPRYLAAADLLLHPAVSENTGNVILEAMVAGLPIMASGICGYSFHVQQAQAGLVLDEPFIQHKMNQGLSFLLQSRDLASFGERGRLYAESADLSSRPTAAVKIIEDLAAHRAKAEGRNVPGCSVSGGQSAGEYC
jgi:UDP-glucose:(heptosyl)LPS alpha-1,3-glucosyltransferase